MSAKILQRIHINKTNIEKIHKWQRQAKRKILLLEMQGFVTVIPDESIFTYDPVTGKKYLTPHTMTFLCFLLYCVTTSSPLSD